MKKFWTSLVALSLGCAVLTTPATAEETGLQSYGPMVGVSSGPDQILFGALVDFGDIANPIRILGYGDVGFGDNITSVTIGPSVVAMFPVEGIGHLYGGIFAGFEYFKYDIDVDLDIDGVDVDDSDTDLGVALEAGWLYPMDNNAVVVDVKIELVDHADVKVGFGYQFAK